MKAYTIKPGIGLGNIHFGATMDECKACFGAPEDEFKEDFEGEGYLTWYYDNGDMALCFEASEDHRLGTIIVYHREATLNDKKIIGKSLDEIRSMLKKDSYTAVEEKDETAPGTTFLSVEDLECTFIFTDDRLEGVQWSYLWDDDETPRWPVIQ